MRVNLGSCCGQSPKKINTFLRANTDLLDCILSPGLAAGTELDRQIDKTENPLRLLLYEIMQPNECVQSGWKGRELASFPDKSEQSFYAAGGRIKKQQELMPIYTPQQF